MSADTKKARDSVADQLDSFGDRLHATVDDVDMLADIQDGIGSLLAASGRNEREIRRVLQERYDAGAMRKETFQLVQSMLNRFLSENSPTSSTTEESNPIPPDPSFNFGEIPVDPTWKPGTESNQTGASPDPADQDTLQTTSVIPDGAFSDGRPSDRAQIGSVLRDRFLLHKEVSGGSMGVVYKALDRRLAEAGSESHWVAIKVLSPQLAENSHALRALQQEAVKGRGLIHPNIVRTIDLDRDDDLYFIVMEWLEGRTLAAILDSDDREIIDQEAALRITQQIGAALEYAHRCGIVHADIKPGNIMILPNGDAKLFDFGVARVQHDQSAKGFNPGVLGAVTPAYSSMQVLTGDEPVAADDVFSLACLLYRLMAGYRVFGARNAAEASQEGMKAQRLQGVSDSQWRALKKALSYARVTRFASVQEFLDALEDSEALRDSDALENFGELALSVDADDRFLQESGGGAGKWFVAALLILGASGFAAHEYGYLDPLLEKLPVAEESPSSILDEVVVAQANVSPEPRALPAKARSVEEETPEEPLADRSFEDEVRSNAIGPASNFVDFASLPEPDLIIPLAANGAAAETISVSLLEGDAPLVLDFERSGDLTDVLSVRLEEVGFSGNRSPWAAGQYALSNSGVVHFPVGQHRGRITLTMASDQRRETDQISTLRVRDVELAKSERAVVRVNLEDDDRRTFEASLPADTVAFATSQVVVHEADPAVQIDIVRFNPADNALQVRYTIDEISAKDGEDYFAPGSSVVSFGPRQRSARILVPLVQDHVVEGDESFVIELTNNDELAAKNVFQRILVVVRDGEFQNP